MFEIRNNKARITDLSKTTQHTRLKLAKACEAQERARRVAGMIGYFKFKGSNNAKKET